MSTQVLTTKLFPPPPRARLVARPRLVERLNTGLQPGCQLILVSAGAGFGKTTLVGEWISTNHLAGSIAWISLDKDDNDPARFLFYLVAALQRVIPGVGGDILPVLQSPQPAPLMELVAQLINQLASSQQNILFVLDDYHLITSELVHQALQLIIERQPQQMHTVILTREDPPFPLPRLRARSQVCEIRERDLRFTQEEAEAFIRQVMGLILTSDEVGMLNNRAEGWVAGIQLAALALEDYLDETSRRAFIDAFTGSDRFIVDYLVSEVLARQPENIQRFLLESSILERFCAELCDRIMGSEQGIGNSRAILEALEKDNMFLVPLDSRRQWYRYHHLFGEMLYNSLRQSYLERIPELHRRAGEWFESQGLIPEAARHTLTSGDWERLAGFLDRHAMRLILQGQGSLVLDWCTAFPKEILQKQPAVCIYYAWTLVLTFRNDYLERVEENLQMAERAIKPITLHSFGSMGEDGALASLRDWVIGQICVVRSQLLLSRFNRYIDPQELIALSQKGLELLPEAEKSIRAICTINLAHAQSMQNLPEEARKAYEETLLLMTGGNNYLTTVTCVFYLARLAYYVGDLDRAEALCREWKARYAAMAPHPERDIPATRGLDIVLALLHLERNSFDEAERLLTQALEVLGWASWMELLGFLLLARLRAWRGDLPGAEDVVHRMENLGPQHASCAEGLRHLLRLKDSPGDSQCQSRAEAWAEHNAPVLGKPDLALGIGPYHSDVEYIHNLTWVQVQIALGNPNAALTYLDSALKNARERGLTFRIIELLVAQALAQETLGEHKIALKMLDEALAMAKPHGYTRVFDEGPSIDRLLSTIADRGSHVHYVERLLAGFNRKPTRQSNASQPEEQAHVGLVEPLSERELEVLRLIATGFSNAQIGERLYITQGTVKRHITNLYGKLLIQTRTQAIARAHELGLL
jgi:LuxR family maltose regulon positive regulatory protein